MQSKLTLRLDAKIIRRAKAAAKKNGKSVSQMVADYFTAMGEPITVKTEDVPPITRGLIGILEGKGLDEADYDRYREARCRPCRPCFLLRRPPGLRPGL